MLKSDLELEFLKLTASDLGFEITWIDDDQDGIGTLRILHPGAMRATRLTGAIQDKIWQAKSALAWELEKMTEPYG